MHNIIKLCTLLVLASCHMTPTDHTVDIQGHRGCRGLLPENTIPAFKKALDIGVTTLELDITVTKAGAVYVSHEPFFNHEISRAPDGTPIPEESELTHNMYVLSDEDIAKYDVGLQPHPRFPVQKKMAVTKPTLADMVTQVEAYAKAKNYPSPLYNIEIKRRPEADDIYHPAMKVFADKAIQTISELGIMPRTTVQCFDVETLQYLHQAYPTTALVYLIEKEADIATNIELLGFTPAVYSPYFELVSTEAVAYCRDHNMKLIPWTVNKAADVEKLLTIGVDGVISDYPDMAVEVAQSLNMY